MLVNQLVEHHWIVILKSSQTICISYIVVFPCSVPVTRFISDPQVLWYIEYMAALRVLGYSSRTMSGSTLPSVWLIGVLHYLTHSWPSKISVE